MVIVKDEVFGEVIKDVKEVLVGIIEGELYIYGVLDYFKNFNVCLLKVKSDLLDFFLDNKYLEDKLNVGIDEVKVVFVI